MVPAELVAKKVDRRRSLDITDIPESQIQLRIRERKRERILVEFGLLYDSEHIHNVIRSVLPVRIGRNRSTMWYAPDASHGFRWPQTLWETAANRWQNADIYPRLIPDAALERYAAAKASELFDGFAVVEPVYVSKPVEQDPWLLGQFGDEWVVLAYWD